MDQFWEPGHLAAVTFTVVAGAGLVVAARRAPGTWLTWVRISLAVALIANQTVYSMRGLWEQNWSIRYDLPLNLCDVAAFVAGGALLLGRRWWVETAYFWAMAGSTMGLLFPDTTLPTLSYGYLEYYIDHAGVILAALLLVGGLRQVPEAGAYRRALTTILGYAALVGMFDVITGANYFTLRAKQSAATLTPLGLLSPWPWYIPEAGLIAMAALGVLALPFHRGTSTLARPPIGGVPAT